MKPLKLTMSAFGSYAGKNVIDFTGQQQGIFLITGDTGAGKTTMLSSLLGLVDRAHRILCVEDAPELDPDHPHVVRLVARAANVEGVGEVSPGIPSDDGEAVQLFVPIETAGDVGDTVEAVRAAVAASATPSAVRSRLYAPSAAAAAATERGQGHPGPVRGDERIY